MAEAAWEPNDRRPRALTDGRKKFYVRAGFEGEGLRAKMKALGGIWRPQHKLWELPWGVVRELGIKDRVVATHWGSI